MTAEKINDPLYRTWAEVHLDRLEANIANMRDRLRPGTELMAVVKGDAYGHGASGVLPTLKACGIRAYAVGLAEEGVALRRSGVEEGPILILGDTRENMLPAVVEHRLTPTVFSVEGATKLQAAAAERGVKQPVALKIETGMNRLGFAVNDRSLADILTIARMPDLYFQSAFTHFTRADEPECGETPRQLALFKEMIGRLREAGVTIPVLHTANSPGTLLWPETHLDMVRVGDFLFGLSSVEDEIWQRTGLREVMTWHSYAAMVKEVPAGEAVGYGGSFVTRRRTVIATIPVGFCDGLDRLLSNRGAVSLRGWEAPIIGRICMDQCMADVTDIPGVRRGDVVTLLGEGMSIVRMAELLDQCTDEIVCRIASRVPRVYVK